MNSQTYAKIVFDNPSVPLVSIIIPAFNQWQYTYSCLASIYENTKGSFEVIVADDASNDETVNISDYVENIKVIRNEDNLGFLRNCNRAAEFARGKYLVFLNNDTKVKKDWLQNLADLMEKDESIGMIGPKLVYPSGRLQEAGGVVWSDAFVLNYGSQDDPDKPQYNYIKEVDYISGACIMIRANLWNVIGGYDERYAPSYYEDTDLAFEVRKRGFKVVYQPKSVVEHYEGISHGSDTNYGIKSYQVKNRYKFFDKWRETLGTEHIPSGQNIFWARDRSKNKKAILAIDHYVPHPDIDAGSKTTYQYIKLFAELGLNVVFMGANSSKFEPYTTSLLQKGVEVLYENSILEMYKWIEINGKYINYVLLNRPHISAKYIDQLKKYTNAKMIYYGCDLHYLRELREYNITLNKDNLKASERWKRIEFHIINKCDVIYYLSTYEIEVIKKHFPGKTVRLIPINIYENFLIDKAKPFKERSKLLYVGGFGHKPNVDAVVWFSEKIFPKILAHVPEIKLYIVGSKPTEEVKNLQSNNIIVTGYVTNDELARIYGESRVVIVPLRYGAGVKGKVIEAMYYGVPVVSTGMGVEGLADISDKLVVADGEDRFALEVISLYKDYAKLEDLSNKSREYVKEHFAKKNAIDVISKDIEV
ncbi:MAG: glycosyltransferase [Bacillota bacterium]